MLTKIEHEGKPCMAILMPNETDESVSRMRDSLLDVLEDVSMSDNAMQCMKPFTLYAVLTIYRHMTAIVS